MLSRQELIHQLAINSPDKVSFDFSELGVNLYQIDNQRLGMHSSHINDAEKVSLFEALAQNTQLQELRIKGCITTELIQLLQSMPGLKSLSFSRAYFAQETPELGVLGIETLKTFYCQFSLTQWLRLFNMFATSLRQYSSINDISLNEDVLLGLNQCALLENLQIERENPALGVLNADSLSQHPSLKKLDLFGGIQFSETGLQALKVQELDIGIMPILAETLFALSDAGQLEKLTLTAQSFSLDFIDTLISKRNITHLGLIHCGVDDLFLFKIINIFKTQGKHLKSLNLSNNMIKNATLLNKFEVNQLDLSINPLSSFGLHRVWHNRKIKKLILDEVCLNYEDMAILRQETSIYDLSVKGCKLSLDNLLEIASNSSIYNLNFAYQILGEAIPVAEQALIKEKILEHRRGAFRYHYVLKYLLNRGILPNLPIAMIADYYEPCPKAIKSLAI